MRERDRVRKRTKEKEEREEREEEKGVYMLGRVEERSEKKKLGMSCRWIPEVCAFEYTHFVSQL